MKAEIITIGDEILIGQIIDSNSAFIAKQLNKIGIEVHQITTVQDTKPHILEALSQAQQRADIVITTGGLGPTKDDITKHTITEFFQDTLVENTKVLKHIEYLFEKYVDTPISDLNRKQALIPSKAKLLFNRFGTAPGMWLEKNDTVFISLPGVPYEMEALIKHEVIPKLSKIYDTPFILHKTILTYGLAESALAERIETWQDNLPSYIKLAYLPNLGKVRLRLSAKGSDKQAIEKEVDRQVKKLTQLVGDYIYAYQDDHPIEYTLGKLLKEKKLTLSTSESCTGGAIAQTITAIPGASAYYKGSIIGYATSVKETILEIPKSAIKQHSVVSAEIVKLMANNARKLLQTDFAVATTGNAGPEKGESDVSIGTVFIAIATPNKTLVEKFSLGNHRKKVIKKAVHKSLEMLQKEILNYW